VSIKFGVGFMREPKQIRILCNKNKRFVRS